MNTFSEKLRELRIARGMSLRKMADELTAMGEKTSHTAIAKWESFEGLDASRLPKRSAISAIAKLFNVRPSWLLEDMYANGVQKRTTRTAQLADIELLTKEEFDVVIAVKDQFLKTRRKETANGTRQE